MEVWLGGIGIKFVKIVVVYDVLVGEWCTSFYGFFRNQRFNATTMD